MNLYDFDDTIYDGDTTKDIILYSLKKYPSKVIKSLLKAKKLYSQYKKGQIKFKFVKEAALSFLFDIDNLNDYITKFVLSHMDRIKPYYLKQRRTDDIVISASYELWIVPFCHRLGIKNVIATRVDDYGKIIGENCKGMEKINRLRATMPNVKIDYAFSDDIKNDLPMLQYAKKGFIIKGNNILPFNNPSVVVSNEVNTQTNATPNTQATEIVQENMQEVNPPIKTNMTSNTQTIETFEPNQIVQTNIAQNAQTIETFEPNNINTNGSN